MDTSTSLASDRIRELSQLIYWDKIRRAREASFEEKFLAGPQLFDYACGIVCAGIRMQNPGSTDEDVERLLKERLELQRRLEKAR
jgi:hypothetical protein